MSTKITPGGVKIKYRSGLRDAVDALVAVHTFIMATIEGKHPRFEDLEDYLGLCSDLLNRCGLGGMRFEAGLLALSTAVRDDISARIKNKGRKELRSKYTTPIASTQLSVRAYNALANAIGAIATVGEVLDSRIVEVKNFGRVSASDVASEFVGGITKVDIYDFNCSVLYSQAPKYIRKGFDAGIANWQRCLNAQAISA